MRKHLLLAAAVMAGLLTILPLTAATAASTAGHSVLTLGSPKGPNVKRGAILRACEGLGDVLRARHQGRRHLQVVGLHRPGHQEPARR